LSDPILDQTAAAAAIERSRSMRALARATRARSVYWRAVADAMRQHSRAIKRSAAARAIRWSLEGAAGSGRSEADVRARLAALIEGGNLPVRPPRSIWAGRSAGGRTCVACQTVLGPGETEYELDGAAGSDGDRRALVLHLRCLELWTLEAERRCD
jgi:hypothetical protein